MRAAIAECSDPRNHMICKHLLNHAIATEGHQVAITQETLARQIGVSSMTVSRWENERNIPSRLAQERMQVFCIKMLGRGKLTLTSQMARSVAPDPDLD